MSGSWNFTPSKVIVCSEGPRGGKIALVGEAPGHTEEQQGRPFVGTSGAELSKLLQGAEINRVECYITNVIKERPPGNNISSFIDLRKKIPLVSNAAWKYIEELKEELESIRANVIVALGNTALWALTGQTGISKWRGSILEGTLVQKKVIPTFHPRAILPPHGVYEWRHLMLYDMRRAREESLFPEIRLPELTLYVRPSFEMVMEFLTRASSQSIVDVDIEVVNEEVSCIAIAVSPTESMSIPFCGDGGDYWHPEQEIEIWLRIAEILENKNITKRGQNFLFDTSFILRRYGIRTTNITDTMVAEGILFPDFPKGLDFITSIHTKLPYYKDEGKKWNRIEHGWERHWLYNAKDTIATAQAWNTIAAQLEQQGNTQTYRRQELLIEPLAFMTERGIRMNCEGIKLAHEAVGIEIDQLKEKLNQTVGYELNPSSPKQLMEHFYGKLKLKPYKNRSTGSDSVDVNALKRLTRKGFKEATILLELRRLSKLRGTYLEIKLDPDNRLRCSFNPVGTQTGRLSSSKTIFGTGSNLQNSPPELKQYMLFDEGYIGYNIDLSQAENRIVAYVGPVDEMARAFEEGLDVHSLTGSLISGLPPEEVKSQDKLGITCPIGGGSYTWRFWGKKANHGLNYDLGYRAFAFIYEIEEKDAKYIVERYHMAYPGVRQGYHKQVRDMINTSRTVINCLGRKRLFLGRWGDELFKEAYAQIPQSTVADIINERGLEYIYYNQDLFRGVELLLQIHDSIIFQIPLTLPWSYHAEALMLIKNKLETPLTWKTRTFTVPIDLQMSLSSMAKGSGLKDIPKSALESRETLEKALRNNYLTMSHCGTK